MTINTTTRRTWGATRRNTLLGTFFVLLFLQRMLTQYVDRATEEATKPAVVVGGEEYANVGEELQQLSSKIKVARAALLPMGFLLPDNYVDQLKNPTTIQGYALAAFALAYPMVPFIIFIDGVVEPSVIGLVVIALSTGMVAFRYHITWTFYRYWPKFILVYLVILLVLVISNIPSVAKLIVDHSLVPRIIGMASKEHKVAVLGGWRVVGIWFLILQVKFFNSAAFLGVLLDEHESCVASKAAHAALVARLSVKESQAAEKAKARQAERDKTLEALRQERAEGSPRNRKKEPVVVHDAEEGWGGLEAKVEEPSFLDKILNFFVVHTNCLIGILSRRTFDEKEPPSEDFILWRLVVAAFQFFVAHTAEVCFVLFSINFVLSGSILDAVLSTSAVVYAYLWFPNSCRTYWILVLLYIACIICLKALINFVVEYTGSGAGIAEILSILFLPVKQSHRSCSSFTTDGIFDFVCIIAAQEHLRCSLRHGVYFEEPQEPNLSLPEDDKSDSSDSCSECSSDIDYEVATAAVVEEQLDLSKIAGAIIANIQYVSGSGADVYTLTFILELFALFYTVLSYFSLSGKSSGSLGKSISENMIPGALVILLLFEVLVMVLDRILYGVSASRHETASLVKFGFHIGIILLYHIVYVIWATEVASAIAGGAILMMLKVLYGLLQAHQIRLGFPLFRHHDPFTRSSNTYYVLAYRLYRGIPFLWVLRMMLDWTCTRTALSFRDFLKVEDVNHEVYVRYATIASDAESNPKKGTPFPWLDKVKDGALMFLLVMFIMFLPLMYYSAFNPNLKDNYVVSSEAAFTVEGFGTLYQSSARKEAAANLPQTVAGLKNIRRKLSQYEYWSDRTIQLMSMDTCSTTMWSLSPSARLLMLETLNLTAHGLASVNIEFLLSTLRQNAAANSDKSQQLRFSRKLSTSEASQLLVAFNESLNSSALAGANTTTTRYVLLSALYDPFVVNLPASAESFTSNSDGAVADNNVDCLLGLRTEHDPLSSSVVQYWCMTCRSMFTHSNVPQANDPEAPCTMLGEQCSKYNFDSAKNPFAQGRFTNVTAPYVMLASDQVPGSVTIVPVDIGIIALYTTFILAIGNVLKSALTGGSHEIVLADAHDPRCVAELITFIYLSRGGGRGSVGDLSLEEQLYFELLDLLRSPETLLQCSGRRSHSYDRNGKRVPIPPLLEW